MNKTDNKKEISSLVPGRQSMFYRPCLWGTWACGAISVVSVGIVLWMVWVRISWNIPEDWNKFIGNGLFPISSLAGLSVTCFTAFLAALIYLRQKQHAAGIYKELTDRLLYGDRIKLDGLLLLMKEWIEKKKASHIFCLSNYSQIPGFWLPVEYAAKIQTMLKISDTPENQVKILLFGPNDDEFENISEEVAGIKRWERKKSRDVIEQYNYERAALATVNNIYFGSLLKRSEMPVNVLIFAEIIDGEQGKTTREVIYGFKNITNQTGAPVEGTSGPDWLAPPELRHAY